MSQLNSSSGFALIRNQVDTSNSPRAKWNELEEKTLVDTLLLEVRRGKRADSGFKISSFSVVQDEIRRVHNTIYELQQIRNKYNAIKKDYDIFATLKNKSGFGWNSERETVDADDEVWDEYLKFNPAARKFRKETLRNYSELEELFDGVRATGNGALLPSQLESQLAPASSSSFCPSIIQQDIQSIASENLDNRVDPVLISLPEPELGKRKKEDFSVRHPKRQRKGKGDDIADALLSVGRTAEKLSISKTEKAINLLMEHYVEELSDNEMVDAVSVFESLRKSETFIALKNGKIRDIWLKRQISLIRGMNESEEK